MVEPRHVGDYAREVALGAERGHQHRRASVEDRARAPPDSLVVQRVCEHRLDGRWPDRCCPLPLGKPFVAPGAWAGRPSAGLSAAGPPASGRASCTRSARPRRPASCRGGLGATPRFSREAEGSMAGASSWCTSRSPATAAGKRPPAPASAAAGGGGAMHRADVIADHRSTSMGKAEGYDYLTLAYSTAIIGRHPYVKQSRSWFWCGGLGRGARRVREHASVAPLRRRRRIRPS